MFLQAYARLLVLLHTAGAIVLIGAATHHGMLVRSVFGGKRFNLRLCRVYGRICAVAYLATFALGGLAYPTYRYYVRGLYLDRHGVWACRLFEVKEDLAVIGVLAALGVWVIGRGLSAHSDRLHLAIYAALVWVVPPIVWFETVSGLLITMARSV